jgi:hypothetical protein
MKVSFCGALATSLFMACSPSSPAVRKVLPADPIERLVAVLSQTSTNVLGFPNGSWHDTGLPTAAAPSDIATRALRHVSTNLTLVQVREVEIPIYGESTGHVYTALLANTESGQKVVLLRGSLHTPGSNLLTRVYNVP